MPGQHLLNRCSRYCPDGPLVADAVGADAVGNGAGGDDACSVDTGGDDAGGAGDGGSIGMPGGDGAGSIVVSNR